MTGGGFNSVIVRESALTQKITTSMPTHEFNDAVTPNVGSFTQKTTSDKYQSHHVVLSPIVA